MEDALGNLFIAFSEDRAVKPRQTGLTIVRDNGLGLNHAEDMVRVAGEYIDIIKLEHGTEALYDKDLIEKKIDLYNSHNVDTMAGEDILEVAIWNRIAEDYLERAKDLGISIISIPRGTIAMRQEIREDIIKRSIHRGFKVITILGRRHPEEELSWSLVLQLISDDLKLGVFKVLIRAERNSSGFGICDSQRVT